MWLPLMHISVSLWISLLSFCVTADFPRLAPDLWFPYDVPNDFAQNAEEYYQQHQSSHGRSCLFGFPRPRASAALSTQEKNVLDYFEMLYPTGQALSRTRRPVQIAMQYLVRKESTSSDLLRSWKSQLATVLDDHPTGEVAATIAYAVYTLLLKNHGKDAETRILSSIFPPYMERLRSEYARLYPNGAPGWEQEIFAPHNGLSTDLGTWGTFRQQLQREPTLEPLSEAISQGNFDHFQEHLADVRRIFALEPSPKLFSSHTRVAAIALLFHAMHNTNKLASLPAVNTAHLLLTKNRNYFLFEHEKTLLTKLYDDYVK